MIAEYIFAQLRNLIEPDFSFQETVHGNLIGRIEDGTAGPSLTSDAVGDDVVERPRP